MHFLFFQIEKILWVWPGWNRNFLRNIIIQSLQSRTSFRQKGLSMQICDHRNRNLTFTALLLFQHYWNLRLRMRKIEIVCESKASNCKIQSWWISWRFWFLSVMNNPFLFWDSQHTRKEYWQHPELRIVALRILFISLGEVSCERLFSALKVLVDSKPTKLFSKACLWFMGSQGHSRFCAW